MRKRGIIANPLSPRLPFVATIERGSNIGYLPEHLAGYFYIQDLASVLAVLSLAPSPKDTILDGCAAPGGKTTLISQQMGNKGTVVANEIDKRRVISLTSNIARMGSTNVIVTNEDLTQLPLSTWKERFNKILIDAPCTGDGLLPHKHETLHTLSAKRVAEHSNRQKQLLQTALKMLMPGGILVYSTCSFTIEQNEAVVKWFLERNSDIELLPVDIPFDSFEGFVISDDDLSHLISSRVARLFPFPHQTVGFFISRFQRRG
jgi:ribosomal RNA methyltransferase Nop2